jgi:hypothetical protein
MRLIALAAGAAVCLVIGLGAVAASNFAFQDAEDDIEAPHWEGTFFGASYYEKDDISHLVARVQIGGEFVHADLGDRRFFDDHEIELGIGQPIGFHGEMVRRGDEDWVRATHVTVDGETYDLLDEDDEDEVEAEEEEIDNLEEPALLPAKPLNGTTDLSPNLTDEEVIED